jgi:hypothetical protein
MVDPAAPESTIKHWLTMARKFPAPHLPDKLGSADWLSVTPEERNALRLRQIGCVGETADDRRKRKAKRDVADRKEKRRADGVQPRAEYLAIQALSLCLEVKAPLLVLRPLEARNFPGPFAFHAAVVPIDLLVRLTNHPAESAFA